MKITAEPRSDQWNAEDFIQGPRTFTIAGVKEGAAEQKYDIVLEGSDRVWRPPLTVLRILLSAWGDEASAWTGRRATLYRDESIRFGPSEVGGIRVSHLSHIDKPVRVNLSEKRGSRKVHTVQPLIEAPTSPTIDPSTVADWVDQLSTAETLTALQGIWGDAGRAGVAGHPQVMAAKETKKKELGA
jgi:hypothetical protein